MELWEGSDNKYKVKDRTCEDATKAKAFMTQE